MASKYSSRLPAMFLSASKRYSKRDTRSMGTLAFQYLHAHQELDQDIPQLNNWSGKGDRSPTSFDDAFLACPETATGQVHVAEMLDNRMKTRVLESQGIQPQHELLDSEITNIAPAPLFNDTLLEHPETASGQVHFAEMLDNKMKAKVLESQGIPVPNELLDSETTAIDPLTSETLLEHPETAYGQIYATEMLDGKMKARLLASQGLFHAVGDSTPQVSYQHFLDQLFLMSSPETAGGYVHYAEMIDDNLKAELLEQVSRQQQLAAEIPKTISEALADSRAVVITSASSPFDVVDVNDAWVGLCEYSREEALHRNLGELLQGPETSVRDARDMIYRLKRDHYSEALITNYTKNGRKFQNRVKVGLLSDSGNDSTEKYFVGVLEEIQVGQKGTKLSM